jgi:glutamine synthetase
VLHRPRGPLPLVDPRVHQKFIDGKRPQADRCPRALGALIKPAEVPFRHEVTNQYLWTLF